MIRPATQEDAAACAAIYAPYVTDTAISFEATPPGSHEMARRIAVALLHHSWLVHEEEGPIVGYAYAGEYKSREAYRWACEVSVYVARDRRGAGIGRGLYEALFEVLARRGYRMAIAGMTLPNPPSERLHRALGFEAIGIYRRIGFKQGAWHDVAWMQRPLSGDPGPPAELT